jgi:hypothetical protein
MESSTMSESDHLKELKQRAADVGLTRLTDRNVEQLQRATQRSQKSTANLQVPLSVADEPAHIFTLVRKG